MNFLTITFRGQEQEIGYYVKDDEIKWEFVDPEVKGTVVLEPEEVEIIGKCWDDYYNRFRNSRYKH